VAIQDASGNVTLIGGDDVNFTATGDVTVLASGTVGVQAQAGAIAQVAADFVQTNGGNIAFTAATSITLGLVDARLTSDRPASVTSQSGWGSVALTAGTTITDAQARNTNAVNIYGYSARLEAGTGIGLLGLNSDEPIVTEVSVIAAETDTSGGIDLLETVDTAVRVDTVGPIAVNQVAANASTSTTSSTAAALSDLTTAGSGSIVLVSQAGTITLNDGADPANGTAITAGGAGNVYVSTVAAGTDVLANADIVSGSGNITVLAARNDTFAAAVDVATGGGTVDVEAGTGAITFNADALVSTVANAAAGGAVRMLAATNITLGGVTAGTANVSLTATAGTIYNGGTSFYADNVAAAGLRLSAGTGAGLAATHLITNVGTVSAVAGAGGIFLSNDTAVSVNSVAVTVQEVAANSVAGPITDGAQASLTTSANGAIVLQSVAGTITLASTVSANGAGNILIQAAGAGTSVLGNATVQSGSGQVTILGAFGVTFSATDNIQTGGGTIDVQAGTDAITFNANSLVSTVANGAAGGAIRMLAATNITLGGVTAGTSNVSLTATAGTIFNGGTTSYGDNVVAAGLRLWAGTGAGQAATHLITRVGTISATAGSGGIFVSNDIAIAVGTVAATVEVVNSAAGVGPVTDGAQSGLTTVAASAGSIVLQSVAGTITLATTVSADGAGNILIQAQGAATDVAGTATVESGTGNVTVLGARNVSFSATDNILTGGGTIDVESGTGAITFDPDALVSTVRNSAAGGAVRMLAATNITLGGVTAGTGSVSLTATAGTIYNGGTTSYSDNVVAAGLRLWAGTGAGLPATHLITNVGTVSGTAGAGGIFVSNDVAIIVGSVAVTVQKVNSAAVAAGVTDSAPIGLTTATSSNGAIVLQTVAGTITLNQAVAADGSGNILIQAAGALTDVLGNASVTSVSGNLTILGARSVTFAATDNIETDGGTIDVEAGTGSITFNANSLVSTVAGGLASGAVRLLAAVNVTLGEVTTGLSNVSVTATAGTIYNGGTTSYSDNVVAAGLRLWAGTGAGVAGTALVTDVGTLSGVAGSGGIFVSNDVAVTVGSVAATVQKVNSAAVAGAATDATQSGLTTSANGSIVLATVAGTLTLASAVSASGTGNILLQASGAGTSVAAGAAVASGTGNITVLGAQNVSVAAGDNLQTGGGTVDVESGTGAITFDPDALVSTVLNSAAGGAVRMLAATSITLGGVTAGTANVSLTATAGTIYNGGTTSYSDNVVAADLLLNAGTGAGLPGTHLITKVGILAATAGSGGIFVSNDITLTVGTVSATVQKVNSSAVAAGVTDGPASGLTTLASSNGAIVLQSVAGTITLSSAVTASGTGNILIQAAGAGTDLLGNAAVATNAGNITLLGARSVTFGATDNIATGGGTIDVVAGTGAITYDPNTLVSTVAGGDAGAAVRMLAATNITLGGVTAGTGNVSLTATAGTIYNGGNADYADNVVAAGLRLSAGTGAGLAATHLITDVATLSGAAGTGGIFVSNDVAITVGTVAVTVAAVNSAALTAAVIDAAQSGLTTSANGAIVLQTVAGALTLNSTVSANGTGNVLVQAVGAGTSVQGNATVQSGTGNITVLGAQNVAWAAGDNIQTGGGTIDVEAGTGGITLNPDALISTVLGGATGNAIRLLAQTNITLGGIAAGNANVSLTATTGSILNGGTAFTDNVAAGGLRLSAVAGGAGMAVAHLITNVGTISAVADSSGIFVSNDTAIAVGSVAVTIQKVTGAAAVAPVTDAAQASLTSDASSSGGIVLQTVAGTITLNSTVSANGSGNILIQAGGAGANVQGNATVESVSGNITILGAAGVAFAAGDNIETGGGTIDVEAGTAAIGFDPDALVSTVLGGATGGAVRMAAGTSITLGGVNAGTANVSLTAIAGTIYNGGNASYADNVVAAGLRLSAGTGAGLAATHLITDVGTVSAVAGSGGIFVTNDVAIAVGSVSATVQVVNGAAGAAPVTDPAQSSLTTSANGAIVLQTVAGAITLNSTVSANGTGNVLVQAEGAGTSVQGNATVQSGSGNITILGAQNVAFAAGDNLQTGGGTIDVAAGTGAITYDPDALVSTVLGGAAGGAIRMLAATSITLGGVNAGIANVSLTATAGTIFNGGNASYADNVVAAGLRLSAVAGGAGQSGVNLVTSVATISAVAGPGGIFVSNDTAIAVGSVAVAIQQVNAAAGVAPVTDAAQSGLTTNAASNGSIVLQSVAGTITVNSLVSANGTGNILIQAAGAATGVQGNATVQSGSGNITILGAQNVAFAAADNVQTGGGTIDVEAGTGAITFNADALVSTVLSAATGNAIRLLAGTNVTLGGVTAGTANVSVTATAGTIYNGGTTSYADNVVAAGLRLSAGTGAGLAATHLVTDVGTVSAVAGSGGIFVSNDVAIAVASVAVTVQKVSATASAAGVTDAAQASLTTSANGAIVLQSVAGTITLNSAVTANGAGNVLIQAAGAGTSVQGNATVQSGSGNLTILGALNVAFAAADNLQTGGGTIDAEAGTGAITFDPDALVSTVLGGAFGGAVRMLAATNITLGGVTAGTGNVSLTATAGTIYNGGTTSYADNVVAAGLRLSGGTGAGLAATHLITNVATISAVAGSGGIFVSNDTVIAVGSVAVTIQKVSSAAAVAGVTDAAQSGLTTATASNGSIVLQSVAGTITLNSAVSANGTGNVLVQAEGAGTGVQGNATVQSGSGNLTILGAAGVAFAAADNVQTGGGTIDVEAGTGAITFNPDTLVTTVLGGATGSAVRLLAGTDVILGGVTAGTANVSITATAGTIYNGGTTSYADNVVAAGLRLWAGTGAGLAGTHLITDVATVAAVAGSGGIFLSNDVAIAVGSVAATVAVVGAAAGTTPATDATQSGLVTSANGAIVLQTGAGAITVNSTVSANGTGNILIQAAGAAANVQGNATVESGSGNITILGPQNVAFGAGANLQTGGGTIDVEAGTGSIGFNVDSLVSTVWNGAAGGAVRMLAATSITLGGVNSGTGAVSLTATTGGILNGGTADYTDNVAGAALRLSAATGVGLAATHLITNVGTLSAVAGSGGIFVSNDTAVTVNTVSATIQKVGSDASVSAVTDAALSDLTTSANGSIVLQTVNGSITLNDGTAPANNDAIVANGTGNVLVQAQGANANVSATAAIVTGTGSITVAAANNVTLSGTANLTVAGNGGTIDVVATAGTISQAAGLSAQTDEGNISFNAGASIVLGIIDARLNANRTALSLANQSIWGNVALTAGSGTITVASGSNGTNIYASAGRLEAGAGIGALGGSAAPVVTEVITLAGQTDISGGINLLEDTSLAIDTVAAVPVNVINSAAAAAATSTPSTALAGLTAAAGGSIVLVAVGSITLNQAVGAGGSGNVLIENLGGSASVIANAAISSGSGNLTVIGATNVTLTGTANLTVSGTGGVVGGTIDVVATTGTISQAANLTAQTDEGNIAFTAGTSIILGTVDARFNTDRGNSGTGSQPAWGNVALTAINGTITDAQARTVNATNIYADNARLEAGTGIGALGSGIDEPIVTELLGVAAKTDTSGGINLLEDTAITVGALAAIPVNLVAANGTTSTANSTAAALSNLATAGNGAIILVTTNGSITVSGTITAGGSGNVLVEAQGTGSGVAATAAIASGSGSIAVGAAGGVTLSGTANLIVGGLSGTIDVVAQGGSISQGASLTAQTDEGDISFTASASIILGTVDARLNSDRQASSTANQPSWGNVALTAGTGTITDAQIRGLNATNIYANGARLEAGAGIGLVGTTGSDEPIVTEVSLIAAKTDTSGGINLLDEVTSLAVDSVPTIPVNLVAANGTASAASSTASSLSDLTTAGNGDIVLVAAAGSITLNDGVVANGLAVSAGGSGNVLVEAPGTGASLTANAGISSGSGSLTVSAANNLTLSGTANLTVGGTTGTIEVVATAGTINQAANLSAQTGGGNIAFTAGTNIDLGIVNAGAGNVALTATSGMIVNSEARPASVTNVTATDARIESATGIGLMGAGADNPIIVAVTVLAARADVSGAVNIEGVTGYALGAVAAVAVNQVAVDGTTAAVTAAGSLSSLTPAPGGSVILATVNGAITISNAITATGNGNILIDAGGAGSDLTISAAVQTATGNITLIGGRNVILGGDVTVAGAGGTVGVTAQTGAITQTAGLYVETDGANIIFTAATSIALGTVDARVNSDRAGTLTSQTNWGSVALTAIAGAITNAQTASATNVYANNLRLESESGLGTLGGSGVPLVTEAVTLAAATDGTVSAGINLLENTAVAVGSIGVFSVNQVATNGSTATASTTALAGVTTAAGSSGAIVLVTTNGTLTVNSAVGAGGAGNILLQAQESGSSTSDLDVNAGITAATGSITLTGANNVNFTASGNVTVSGTGGTVEVTAQAGAISQAAGLAVQTNGANIIFTAATNVALGIVDARTNADRSAGAPGTLANWGDVAITATGGAVTNSQIRPASVTGVYADYLRLESQSGLGVLGGSNNPIITEVATLAGQTDSTASGDINLAQGTAVTVGAVPVFSVNQVGAGGSTSLTTTTALAGLATAVGSTGAIVLVTANGTITVASKVTAGASGNVLLQAQGSGSSVLGQAGIKSVTGNITIVGANNVTFTAGSVKVTGAGGTIQVIAQGGSISQAAGLVAQTDGANIIFTAAVGITVGVIDARVTSDQGGTVNSPSAWGNVALTASAGTIVSAGSSMVNVYANGARLEAALAIGVLGSGANPLIVEATTVAARTDSTATGGINLDSPLAVTVNTVAAFTVNQVAANGSAATASTTALSDLATGTGSIVLATNNGSITLDDGINADAYAINAGSGGNILVAANGTGASVVANAGLISGSGSVTVSAADNVTLTGTGNLIVSGGSGTITVQAVAGAVAQGATLVAQTNGGNIGVEAGAGIVLGILDARVNADRTGHTLASQSVWGDVAVNAQGGAITNAQAQPTTLTNIYASGADLVAATGVGLLAPGSSNPIVTEVAVAAAATTVSGGIDLLQQTAVVVDAGPAFNLNVVGVSGTTSPYAVPSLATGLATAGNGAITLVTINGGITLNAAVNPSAVAVDAAGAGNVLIEAQGATSDLTVNAAIDTGTGNVTLSAGRNVLFGSAVTQTVSGYLDVAATGSVGMNANNVLTSGSGILVSAGVNAALGQVDSADVWINATGSVTNAGGASTTNVTATNAVIDAGNAVGTAAAPIETAVTTLTAAAGAGGISLAQAGATTLGPVSFSILSVNADSSTSSATVTQAGITTGTGGGAIALAVTGGGITLNENISSPAGVTLTASGAIQENIALADAGAFTVAGSSAITMAAAATLTAASVALTSAGNISVSAIATGAGAIAITGGASLINVLGSGGAANLTGGTAAIQTAGSIGTTADVLNTAVTALSATVTGTGSIAVAQTAALILTNATTANGLIQVNIAGNLNAVAVAQGGTGGVALGTLGSLYVGSVTAAAAVTASAAGQIDQATSETSTANITAPQLILTAGTGIGVPSYLVVAVPLLAASSTTGNIQIRNLLTTAVTVSSLTTGTGTINYSQAGGTANVTSATTTNGSVNLSMDNGALNAGTVTAGGSGNINFNVTGTGQVQYNTATAGGGTVSISTSQSATLSQNIVTNGQNVTLSGPITLTQNTTITTNGGAVTFMNALNGPYALTINAGSGAVDFASAVGSGTGNPLTSLTVNTTSTITVGKTLAVQGNISFTGASLTLSGGANSVSTTNGGQFIVQALGSASTVGVGAVASAGGYTLALTPTDIAALAPGFSTIVIGSATATARVDVASASFTSPVLIQSDGTVQVLAGQTLAISGANALALTAGAGDSGQVVMQMGSAIAAGSGTVTLTGDELVLGSSAGSITGTGTLVLEPLTLSRPIIVGSAGVSGQFALTLPELAVPATTMSVVIGDAAGTGAITVYPTEFDTPVTFQAEATTGSLTISGNIGTTLANEGITANIGGNITVAGNVVIGTSGSISLNAGYGSDGVGSLTVAQATNEFMHTASGNISLSGQNVILGTFSLWTQIMASGSINVTVGAVGGTLQVNDIYSEIKAGGNVVIASGATTASTTGQLELEGQVQAVGTISVTSNSSINLDNSTLVAQGNIAMQSTGNIQLSAGSINSQKGTVTITANSGQNGTGTLSLGGISPILINSSGGVSLTGESVAIGNSVAFARIVTTSNLSILANNYVAGQGTVSFANASTQVQVTGNIQIGASNYGAGTPYNVSFAGGTIGAGGTFSLYALDNVTSASTTFTATGAFSIAADDNLTLNAGTVVTDGSALTLLADAGTGLQGALALASGVTITDPSSTVTLSGYTVANSATISASHVTTTPGH